MDVRWTYIFLLNLFICVLCLLTLFLVIVLTYLSMIFFPGGDVIFNTSYVFLIENCLFSTQRYTHFHISFDIISFHFNLRNTFSFISIFFCFSFFFTFIWILFLFQCKFVRFLFHLKFWSHPILYTCNITLFHITSAFVSVLLQIYENFYHISRIYFSCYNYFHVTFIFSPFLFYFRFLFNNRQVIFFLNLFLVSFASALFFCFSLFFPLVMISVIKSSLFM